MPRYGESHDGADAPFYIDEIELLAPKLTAKSLAIRSMS